MFFFNQRSINAIINHLNYIMAFLKITVTCRTSIFYSTKLNTILSYRNCYWKVDATPKLKPTVVTTKHYGFITMEWFYKHGMVL